MTSLRTISALALAATLSMLGMQAGSAQDAPPRQTWSATRERREPVSQQAPPPACLRLRSYARRPEPPSSTTRPVTISPTIIIVQANQS